METSPSRISRIGSVPADFFVADRERSAFSDYSHPGGTSSASSHDLARADVPPSAQTPPTSLAQTSSGKKKKRTGSRSPSGRSSVGASAPSTIFVKTSTPGVSFLEENAGASAPWDTLYWPGTDNHNEKLGVEQLRLASQTQPASPKNRLLRKSKSPGSSGKKGKKSGKTKAAHPSETAELARFDRLHDVEAVETGEFRATPSGTNSPGVPGAK